MARGVNKWIGIGNCCDDPDTRHSASGAAITNVTVACNDGYKDKTSGQMVDTTEFVRVVFFNRLAEVARDYMRKGSKCYLEGSLRTRKWQDQQGQDRWTTEIVASELRLLDGKPQEGAAAQPRSAPPGQQSAPDFDGFDDDIHF
jgi:single-strand DNA-binding protein